MFLKIDVIRVVGFNVKRVGFIMMIFGIMLSFCSCKFLSILFFNVFIWFKM